MRFQRCSDLIPVSILRSLHPDLVPAVLFLAMPTTIFLLFCHRPLRRYDIRVANHGLRCLSDFSCAGMGRSYSVELDIPLFLFRLFLDRSQGAIATLLRPFV